MPRLSIVVPFTGNQRLLHDTLLSVFECRPNDVEVLLSHDGSYRDPYRLLGDEVIDIAASEHSSSIDLINEAVMAACAPYVQVLIPGTQVESGWVDESLDLLDEDSLVTGVILPTKHKAERGKFYGFDTTALPRRIELHKPRYRGAATPAINGTVFRRKVLRLMNGFLNTGSVETCELEFGLAMRTLGLEAVIAEESQLSVDAAVRPAPQGAYARGQRYGQLAFAYSKIEASGVEISTLMSRLGHLAGGLMKPQTVAERLGWVLGLTDARFVMSVRNRISIAANKLAELTKSDSPFSDSHSTPPVEVHAPASFRRAA